MQDQNTCIAIVGGGEFAAQVIKTTIAYYAKGKQLNARIHAVYSPDPNAPAMRLARAMHRKTFTELNKLYNPKEGVDVIIVLDPDPELFEKILHSKPPDTRIVSYTVFKLFWDALTAESKKFKEKAQEQETILQSIQENILVIAPDLTILEANEACLQQIGYERSEMIGKKCFEIFQRSNRQCHNDALFCPLKIATKTRRSCKQILPRLNKNGQVVYLEICIYPIWSENGTLSKFVEISRDVSDQLKQNKEINHQLEKLLEKTTKELEKREQELIHQDKMASLGKLSASVVHEINNPISGLLNLVLLLKRIIQEGHPTPQEIKQFHKYLSLMESEIRRVSRITSNLLTFSKGRKTEFNQVNLNQLAEEVLFLCGNMFKINQVTICKDLAPNLPDIIADGEQLKQVIINLVSNGLEAMEGQREKVLEIKTKEKNKLVLLIFKDNGPGIATEDQQKIFEPFFTTKKKGKGVGLGLSVVYGIIKQHCGSIELESSPGQGTCFTISLPLTQATEKYH